VASDESSAITGATPEAVAAGYANTRSGTLTTLDGGSWTEDVAVAYSILSFGSATDVRVASPDSGAGVWGFCSAGDHLRLDDVVVALTFLVDGDSFRQEVTGIEIRDYPGGQGIEQLRTLDRVEAVLPASLEAVAATWTCRSAPIGPDPVISPLLGPWFSPGGSVYDAWFTVQDATGCDSGFAELRLE
jgi:hypothetical protein